ncbi:MAG: GTPase domain-containing protein [Armatimonadetes bacterium]|nr:GTPase domain-containing protein [Armatimonadota bacterium]
MADLAALIDQLAYLAEPALCPERWAALDRLRRLYDCRFRDAARRARPPLVVLLGGTNVGKSTIFNLLLGQTVSRDCPTPVGTKAVALSVRRSWADALLDPGFLPGWRKLAWHSPDEINEPFDDDQPRLYLHLRDSGPDVALADTPDIDSVRRFNEREAEDLFYLADALLYVTSEQKYADEACVEYLRRAMRFTKPVLAVLDRGERDGQAFADFSAVKLPGAGVTEPAAVLALPWLNIPGIIDGSVPPPPSVGELRAALDGLAAAGPELVKRSARGAALGLADELESALAPLEAERGQVAAWEQRAGEAVADAARDYLPHVLDPDDLDQAVLEALAELRVPGLDWVYEQLGLVGRRMRLGARLFGHRLGNLLGRPLRTAEDVETERLSRERDQVRRLLSEVLAALRRDLQSCPAELRGPLLARLPDLVGNPLEETVFGWLGEVETARRAIIDDAKARIVADLQTKGTIIRGFKAVTRTATMAVSVVVALHTGQVGAHDLAVAPLADALTKAFLDKVLGDTWRRQLEAEVDSRRRAALRTWLERTAIAPVLDSLPPSHRAGFAEALRDQVAALAKEEA